MDAEPAKQPAELNEGQPEKQGEKPASSDNRAFEDPEDGVGKSEIARELNVDGIIEGTVQRSGDRVRITAQLIYGPSDKHLWASSCERDLRDIFALERNVADDIAHQVQARLTTQNQAAQ